MGAEVNKKSKSKNKISAGKEYSGNLEMVKLKKHRPAVKLPACVNVRCDYLAPPVMTLSVNLKSRPFVP